MDEHHEQVKSILPEGFPVGPTKCAFNSCKTKGFKTPLIACVDCVMFYSHCDSKVTFCMLRPVKSKQICSSGYMFSYCTLRVAVGWDAMTGNKMLL